MGFAKCFSNRESKQIHIIYTDTLRKTGSMLFTYHTDKSRTSVEDISNYLAATYGNEDVKTSEPVERHSKVLELFKNFETTETDRHDHASTEKPRKYSSREWIAFVSVCVVMATNISVVHAFGTLFPYILLEFGENRANTATIQSVLFGVGLCSGLIVGSVVQHFGPGRCGLIGSCLFSLGFISSFFAASTAYLIISCGILSGLGFSFLTISSNQAASLCFDGHAKLVGLSVVSSAIGVGAMLYPYILTWMVDEFGLKGTFLLLGGITMNGIPMALLWRNLNKSKEDHRMTQTAQQAYKRFIKSLLNRIWETMGSKQFLFALLGFSLAMPSVNIFEILALDILESSGLARDHSVMLFIILNAVSIPGRLVPGFIKRIQGLSSMTAPIIGTAISGIGLLLVNLAQTLLGSGVACAALGLSKGILLSSVQIIVLEILDTSKFSVGLGIVFGLVGLCTTALGPLNGLLRDVSGSYTVSLFGAACAMILSIVLFSISLILSNRTKANELSKRSVSVFTVTRF